MSETVTLQLGTLITLLTVGVGAALWIRKEVAGAKSAVSDLASTLSTKLGALDNRLSRLESAVHSNWTVEAQKIFELQLSKDNPELSVPDSFVIARSEREA